MTICWRCQTPGAETENLRGEPIHRDCIAAYLPRPENRTETNDSQPHHVEDITY